MWAFSVNEYQRGSTSYYDTAPTRSFKAFDVDDFIGSLFRPEDAFVHAASLNQTEVVQRWITKNHDVNALDKEGHMALGIAAQNQCMDVLHLLVDHGASVDQPQADGKAALHLACMWGRYEAATLLLHNGANTSNRDKDGQTPLHGACRNGHDHIVQLLLASSIDPFVADECGATPFDLARDWQRVEMLKTLDQYHHAIFKPLMQSAVRSALNPRSHSKSQLPSSMQRLVCSFLC
ncbi:hypothetical protein Poli38472_005836 [Pythium oligandrum]|uniref:ANK_REP_REGION domain-containing protein n=1 Tax=Pythium oligandrum TaxID=41045 RepID=A0A8K1FSA5_PYTOL|nr:hypothetical protein Poli38472_005836 [Pythium oligandrum]|eukprot:TMW68368.1 hypothetical protein Poli38472_005836 [Pythium oligandrum]